MKGASRLAADAALGAVMYVATARLGMLFALFHDAVSPLWPASGVVVALVLVRGPGVMLGAFVGALTNDALNHGLTLFSALVGLGSVVECLTAATLLRWSGFERTLPRVRDVLALVFLGAALAPVGAALLGAAALVVGGQVPASSAGSVFATWWLGDALGVLAFTPVVLAFIGTPRRRWTPALSGEVGLAGVLIVLSACGLFLTPQAARAGSGVLVLASLPTLGVVWVALRADQRTAAGATLFVCAMAILGAGEGWGVFSSLTPADRVWVLQLYFVLLSVTAFSVSSLTFDRRARLRQLSEREHELRRTAELTAIGGFSWHLDEAVPRWSLGLHRVFQIPLHEQPLTLQEGVGSMLPADRERYEVLLAKVRRQPEAYRFSFGFVRRDGAIRHARAFVEPVFDAQRRVVSWDGAIQDVTELVEAEQRAREADRLLEKSQRLESLGLLAGGVAHDFNNLLTTILTGAHLIKAEATDPAVGEAADDVERAGRAAAELCRQMLTFAGRAEPRLEPIHLSTLVRDTAQLVAPSLKKTVSLAPTLAPEVALFQGDRTQLGQVVMNLLINASDAMEQGQIRVATTVTTFTGVDPATLVVQGPEAGTPCVELTVEDEGAGMSPDTLQRIFQPFFTTKPTGRGLGLATTLGIVQQHGGALALESTLGVGSRFRLWFPVGRSRDART